MNTHLFAVNPIGYAVSLNYGGNFAKGIYDDLTPGIYAVTHSGAIRVPTYDEMCDSTYQIPMPEFGV